MTHRCSECRAHFPTVADAFVHFIVALWNRGACLYGIQHRIH